jgi:hypothetical protein
MGKKQFKVLFDVEAPQIIYADRHVTRGDHGASFFNEARAGEGATELVADFPKVLGVVQDLAYVPPVAVVRELSEATAIEFPPSVSIGAINITVGSIEEARAALASVMIEARAVAG